MIQLPIDGGPIYAETNLSAFPVEPWNAISSLAIILPAIYWAFKMKFKFKDFAFIYSCVILLILGGSGSVLYHAFRTSQSLLLMDVLPAALLTIIISVYFWFKILPGWFQTIAIVVPFVGIRYLLLAFLPTEMATNIGYFISGTMFFLPILVYLNRNEIKYVGDIVLSIVFLLLSLMFREIDQSTVTFLPMGSHFLWHIFSGVGAYFLGNFLFRLRSRELLKERS